MKTETQIREDIAFFKNETTKSGKPKPNTKKIKVLVELIKIVQNLPQEKVEEERVKLINDLKKREDLFPEFFERFTDFRLRDSESQKKEVRKRFDKEFSVKEMKSRIDNLNYLLER